MELEADVVGEEVVERGSGGVVVEAGKDVGGGGGRLAGAVEADRDRATPSPGERLARAPDRLVFCSMRSART